MERKVSDIKGLKETLDLLRYPGSEIKIIGSFSDPKLKYFSDVDSQTIVETEKDYFSLKKNFQKIAFEVDKNQNLTFLDFKAGFVSGKPVKWTLIEILAGYTHTSTGVLKFEDVFAQTSIIKIDVVLWTPSKEEVIEVTVNYYFTFPDGSKTFRIETDEVMRSKMLWDYQNLKEKNFFKAIKRLYTFYKFTKDEEAQDRVLRVLNSNLGAKAVKISKMKTIVDVLKLPYYPRGQVLKVLPKGSEKYNTVELLKRLEERIKVDTENLSYEARESLLAEN